MEKIRTVFVIEDSRIISEIISLQLKMKFKCDVITFENGDNIISETDKYSPDLIILDYNFGNKNLLYINGLKVLIQLRKTYKTPVIIFSGQRDKKKALEIIHAGAIDYIDKDDDDFMINLLTSVDDVFKIQVSKGRIEKLKSKLKTFFIILILLLLIGTSVIVFTDYLL
jgi:DNA-binding NtrC family response regulator